MDHRTTVRDTKAPVGDQVPEPHLDVSTLATAGTVQSWLARDRALPTSHGTLPPQGLVGGVLPPPRPPGASGFGCWWKPSQGTMQAPPPQGFPERRGLPTQLATRHPESQGGRHVGRGWGGCCLSLRQHILPPGLAGEATACLHGGHCEEAPKGKAAFSLMCVTLMFTEALKAQLGGPRRPCVRSTSTSWAPGPSQTGDTGKLASGVCAHVHMCAGVWVCMSVHA